MSNLPRRYGEDEIGELLRRATELQRDEASPNLPSGGLSLQEIEEIAGEVGIDPRYLRQAARELDTVVDTGGIGSTLAGAPVMLVLERTLEGELAEEGFERLLIEIQRNTSEHGQPSLLGRTLTWKAETSSKVRSIQVLISSHDGETHIRIEEQLGQLAGSLYAGIVAGGGVGVGLGAGLPIGLEVLGSALFATAFPIGVLTLSYFVAKGIFSRMSHDRKDAMNHLLERLSEAAEDEIRRSRGALPSAEER
jgi:hypothetical protein